MSDHATWGASAVAHGTPDAHLNDAHTNVVDTLANVMHYCAAAGLGFETALETARGHYSAETGGGEATDA